jgi:uncharacterized protein YkwD
MRRDLAGGLVLVLALLACRGLAAQEDKKAKFELTAEEKRLLKLLNESRAKAKLPPLKVNEVLTKVARAHSANMLKQGKMSHELDGKLPKDRVLDAGYEYRSVGENVASAVGSGAPPPPEQIHKGWMNSKPHRANILSDRFQEVGIGVAHGRKGKSYYTQVFGTQRKKPSAGRSR